MKSTVSDRNADLNSMIARKLLDTFGIILLHTARDSDVFFDSTTHVFQSLPQWHCSIGFIVILGLRQPYGADIPFVSHESENIPTWDLLFQLRVIGPFARCSKIEMPLPSSPMSWSTVWNPLCSWMVCPSKLNTRAREWNLWRVPSASLWPTAVVTESRLSVTAFREDRFFHLNFRGALTSGGRLKNCLALLFRLWTFLFFST